VRILKDLAAKPATNKNASKMLALTGA